MSKILMSGGGGGGDGSDDCTLTLADVPKGLTAVTADSDDEAKAGTLDTSTSAADSHVLTGESYMKFNQEAQHWEKRQGGLKNNGAVNLVLNCGESRQIPGGFTTGGTVKANSLASQTPGTAGSPQILAGQSAWVNGNRVDGAMPNRGGYWGFGNNKGVDAGNQRMWVQVPGGYYDENAQVFLSWADIRNLTGLTPDKIKKNESLMGIIGTFEGYVTSPLYLYSYGTFGGGQTGVSCGSTASLLSDCISSFGRDGGVRFNNIVPTAGYNFLNIVGYAPYKYHDGTATLCDASNKKLRESVICNNVGSPATTKINISALTEPCFFNFGASSWYNNDHKLIYSQIYVQQVYLSDV